MSVSTPTGQSAFAEADVQRWRSAVALFSDRPEAES